MAHGRRTDAPGVSTTTQRRGDQVCAPVHSQSKMRAMRRALASACTIAVSTVAAIAASGCGGPAKVSLTQGSREYVASDYPQVLQRWTRDGQLYNEFDSPLTVTATFNSW